MEEMSTALLIVELSLKHSLTLYELVLQCYTPLLKRNATADMSLQPDFERVEMGAHDLMLLLTLISVESAKQKVKQRQSKKTTRSHN